MPKNSELNPWARFKKDFRSLTQGKGIRKPTEQSSTQGVVPMSSEVESQDSQITYQRISAQVEGKISSPSSDIKFKVSLEVQLAQSLGLDKNDPALRAVVDAIKQDPTKSLPDNYQYIKGGDVLSNPAGKVRTMADELEKRPNVVVDRDFHIRRVRTWEHPHTCNPEKRHECFQVKVGLKPIQEVDLLPEVEGVANQTYDSGPEGFRKAVIDQMANSHSQENS